MHKFSIQNMVANELSWRADLFVTLRAKIVGFDDLKNLYICDGNF